MITAQRHKPLYAPFGDGSFGGGSELLPSRLKLCDFPAYQVPVENSNVCVSSHGGQTLLWGVRAPDGKVHQILFLGSEVDLTGKSPIRGGGQLAGFPNFSEGQFGNFNRDIFDPGKKLPGHGLARNLKYEIERGREPNPDLPGRYSNSMVLLSGSNEATLQQWPHPFDIRSEVINTSNGTRFTQTSIVTYTNRSNQTVPCQGFFHTYFTVGDVRKIGLHGLEGRQYFDLVNKQEKLDNVGPFAKFIRDDETVGRLYKGLASARIEDPVLGRSIEVIGGTTDRPAQEGESSIVLWNPGFYEEKDPAKPAYAGLRPGDSENFVCLESGILEARMLRRGESMQIATHTVVTFP